MTDWAIDISTGTSAANGFAFFSSSSLTAINAAPFNFPNTAGDSACSFNPPAGCNAMATSLVPGSWSPPEPTSEPSTLFLCGTGLLGLMGMGLHKKRFA